MGWLYVWSRPEWADIVRHELMCLYPACGFIPADRLQGLLFFAVSAPRPDESKVQRLQNLVTSAIGDVTYLWSPLYN